MNRYIKKLIKQGESQQLDFKFQITDSKKIARTLVSFANTDGGTILIGVKDNGRIAGIRSEEEYYMIESAAKMHSKPEIEFESEKRVIDGKVILEVKIPKSENIPHMAPDKNGKWRAFIRVNDQNFVVNKIQVEVWRRRRNKDKGVFVSYTDKEKKLLQYLEKQDVVTFSKVMRVVGVSRYKAEKMLINFILMDIIKIVFTEKQVFYELNEEFEKKANQ